MLGHLELKEWAEWGGVGGLVERFGTLKIFADHGVVLIMVIDGDGGDVDHGGLGIGSLHHSIQGKHQKGQDLSCSHSPTCQADP